MRLLVVRHAPAEDRAAFVHSARPDTERPLTARGRDKMTANARGLHEIVPSLDVLATSPYKRAVETAEIIAREYGAMRIDRVSVLEPGGNRDNLLEWLRSNRVAATLGIVGHEPDLGEFIAWLVTGKAAPFCELKKGGAAMIEIPAPATPGQGILRWLLSPAVLRTIRP